MNEVDNLHDVLELNEGTPAVSATEPASSPGESPVAGAAGETRRGRPAAARRRRGRPALTRPSALPQLVTVDEAAEFLCTSRCAIYSMLERGQLPPPVRIGRRVLLVQDELLDWLHQKRAPSLQE